MGRYAAKKRQEDEAKRKKHEAEIAAKRKKINEDRKAGKTSNIPKKEKDLLRDLDTDDYPTIPQGISYVRIDDERVLKVRVSLDVPGSSDPVEEPEPELPVDVSSMPLPPAPGMAIPPPPLPDLPPPVRPDE